MLTQTFTETLVIITCCHDGCNLRFGMDQNFYNERRNDHAVWYCPAGHLQHFSGKSDKEKLKEQLEHVKESNEWYSQRNASLHTELTKEKHKVRSQKAAKTRMLNRIKNGVCPCCNRTFKNLAAHFKSVHPDQVKDHPEILSIHKIISNKKPNQ